MASERKMAAALASLALLLAFVAPAGAQDLSGVIPGLSQLPAPDWVREGTRMSYYSSSANVPDATEKYILDEEGDWVGLTSGKRYRREEVFGAAGHGITQVDVLSVDQRGSLLKITPWSYSNFDGPLVPLKQGYTASLAAGGDWYINPQVLAQLQDRRGGGLTVLRMPYQIGAQTYNAIRIQTQSEAATFAKVYDLNSGQLLATFNAVTGEGTTFAQAISLGVRQMELPWLGMDLPGWLRQGASLSYQGTKTSQVPLASFENRIPLTVSISFTAADQRGYTYRRTSTLSASGFPSVSEQDAQAGGIGEPGGLVLPPAALASLRAGQVIDSDDITGVTVSVVDIRPDYDGRNTVVIQAKNQAYSAQMTYDVDSGVMVDFEALTAGELANDILRMNLVRGG
ncbi:MAG TPA: hypothetical protein PLI05_01870 [Methanotrichaceae archaeon]|nr:hypothetical protein [Methanotrichaceae archaeon]HQF15800.1 hypothetical protein [Methanotrichaceae archaeon]HQI90524.1 hypothetical protein [Methanotrichaceae archaeon]HQJ28087.1 hypothetical protein [Methanotrichaceae archaeon]